MRVRQKRTQLVGRHSAARDRRKARRTLWYAAGGISAGNVAMGAPLPRKLAALLSVGPGSVRDKEDEHRQRRNDR